MLTTDVSINIAVSYKGGGWEGFGEGENGEEERMTPAFGKSRDCSAFVKFNYWQISSADASTQWVPSSRYSI